MDTVDFSILSNKQTERLNEIFREIAYDYTAFVDRLSVDKAEDPYWWCTGLASRDCVLTDYAYDIALMFLIIEIVDNDKYIKEVTINKWGISQCLKRYYSGKRCVKIIFNGKHSWFWNLYSDYKSLKSCISNWFKIKNALKSYDGNIDKDNDLTIIETYTFFSDFGENGFKGRNFGGIERFTEENIVYMPCFYFNNPDKINTFMKAVRGENSQSFLIREKYVKITDVLRVLQYNYACKLYKKGRKVFRGIDVTEIIREGLDYDAKSSCSLDGVMSLCTIQRMRDDNIRIKRLVGWYEGQPRSIALFCRLHQIYPNIQIVGYIGLPFDETCIELSPSPIQKRYGVSPDIVSVLGKSFIDLPKRFDDRVNTIVAPSYRMQSFFNKYNRAYSQTGNKVLVVLTFFMEANKYMIKLLQELSATDDNMLFNYNIKNHPCLSDFNMSDYYNGETSFSYRFVEGDYSEWVKNSNVVIVSESTTTFETVINGRPAIIVSAPGKIVRTLMPKEWENKHYKVVYNSKQLLEAMHFFLDNPYIPLEVKDDDYYIAKATRKNTAELLGTEI